MNIPTPLNGVCASCGCVWTMKNGEPNVMEDWCSPPTLQTCLCHSEKFATLVYEGDREAAA